MTSRPDEKPRHDTGDEPGVSSPPTDNERMFEPTVNFGGFTAPAFFVVCRYIPHGAAQAYHQQGWLVTPIPGHHDRWSMLASMEFEGE